MDTASLSAASPAPSPRTAAPTVGAGDDGGFAALLDRQAAPPAEKSAGKSAARPGKTTAATTDTDTPTPAPSVTAADAAAADTTDAAGAATGTEASSEDGAKGDRGERQIGDGADREVADKLAGDAALTDPSAILTGMLLDLTAPAGRKDTAATTTMAPPAPPAPPGLPSAAAATAAEKASEHSAGARLAAPPSTAGEDKAATAPPTTGTAGDGAGAAVAAADPSAIAAAAPPAPASVATATAPVAAPRTAPVPLDPEALSVAIARKVDEGNHVFEISLTPDDLGRIDVRLEFAEDGQMTARVYADRPETLHLLQQDRAELIRNLSSQGATPQNTTVSFALRDGHAGQNGGNGAGDGGSNGRRGRNQNGGTPEAVASAASPRQRRGGNALAVDIQV